MQEKGYAMKKRLTNKRGDVRELTSADFKKAVPFTEIPRSLQRKLSAIQKVGRPKSANPKKQITFRFDAALIDHLRQIDGYNKRVESMLLKAMSQERL